MANETGGEGPLSEARDQVLVEHREILMSAQRLGGSPDLPELLRRLEEFRALLTPHFQEEEKPDGFFDLIRTRSGRHLGRVRDLENEHRILVAAVDGLTARAQECLAGPVAEILRQAGDLARRLSEHEARENALLIDALYVDIGEED